MNLKKTFVLGIKVHDLTKSEVVERINELARDKSKSNMIVTLGTEMIMAAKNDSSLKELINGAELVCADGIGVVWASGLRGEKIRERAAGIEVLEETVKSSVSSGRKIFFLGASPGIAEKAAERLRLKYPGCNICGTYHGYFKDDSEPFEHIRKASPDILFIALGFPKQEKWYLKYGSELGVPVGVGVGGSFDVLSGKLDRAPEWMRKMGLEWFYRLLREPSRWKRMLSLPLFVLEVIFSGNKK